MTADETYNVSFQSCNPEFTTRLKATIKYNVRYDALNISSIVAFGTLAFFS